MTKIITTLTPQGYGQPQTELKPIEIICQCKNCHTLWTETHKVACILNQLVVYDACTFCIHNSPELKAKYLNK